MQSQSDKISRNSRLPHRTSPVPVIEMFRDSLNRSGIVSTIRVSRGEDIMAACGMLSGSK
ncbi:hypothetical protein MASR1M46_16990 [Bacteroidales bacterium]